MVKELEEDHVNLSLKTFSIRWVLQHSYHNNLRGQHVTDINGYNVMTWLLEADDVLPCMCTFIYLLTLYAPQLFVVSRVVHDVYHIFFGEQMSIGNIKFGYNFGYTHNNIL